MTATGIEDYEPEPFSASIGPDRTMEKPVYRASGAHGPPVILMHEAPGLTTRTLDLGRRIAAAGMSPVLPLLVGAPEPGRAGRARNLLRVCIAGEFGAWTRSEAGPTVGWLRALARHEAEGAGGGKVGVIGMCFSGGYALAMALDPAVGATVASQPAFPVAIPGLRGSFGVDAADHDTLRERTDDGACVRHMRFQRDPMSPGKRQAAIKRELPRSEDVEIRTWNPRKHSVLGEGLEPPGCSGPNRALRDTIAFLQAKLAVTT